MSTYHPITELVSQRVERDGANMDFDDLDAVIREQLAPPTLRAESGVSFADTSAKPYVEATFVQSGQQMQMALIGSEPVLLIQPEYDIDTHSVTLLTTAVDLPPPALVEVLEVLLDGARQMVETDLEKLEEIESTG